MSLLPLHSPGDSPDCIHDQYFGLALTSEDLLTTAVYPILSMDYHRSWRRVMARKDLGSIITGYMHKMQINLDVHHFALEEITVKTSERFIVIEGNHEEKWDEDSYVSRRFTRRYVLPHDCNPESVKASLSSDGILTVVVLKTAQLSQNFRWIPITQTGAVRKDIEKFAMCYNN